MRNDTESMVLSEVNNSFGAQYLLTLQVKDAHMDIGVDCGFQEVVNTKTDAI